MRMWFYRTDTGMLTGDSYVGGDLEANTPDGCAAIGGVSDWQAQCVDLATTTVVDWQPPAPADTDLQTWAWDATARRWLPTPTEAAVAAEVRAERDHRLAVCDWVVTRATELAEAVPAPWLAYRANLRDLTEQSGFPYTHTWPTPPAD